jgi:hypothetical protein
MTRFNPSGACAQSYIYRWGDSKLFDVALIFLNRTLFVCHDEAPDTYLSHCDIELAAHICSWRGAMASTHSLNGRIQCSPGILEIIKITSRDHYSYIFNGQRLFVWSGEVRLPPEQKKHELNQRM